MLFNTCTYCGANLDPGERCDCTDIKKERTAEASAPTNNSIISPNEGSVKENEFDV